MKTLELHYAMIQFLINGVIFTRAGSDDFKPIRIDPAMDRVRSPAQLCYVICIRN